MDSCRAYGTYNPFRDGASNTHKGEGGANPIQDFTDGIITRLVYEPNKGEFFHLEVPKVINLSKGINEPIDFQFNGFRTRITPASTYRGILEEYARFLEPIFGSRIAKKFTVQSNARYKALISVMN